MAERDHHRKPPSGSLWGEASQSSFWSCPSRSQVTASFHPASVFVPVCPGPGSPGVLGFSSRKGRCAGFWKGFLCVEPPLSPPPSPAAH